MISLHPHHLHFEAISVVWLHPEGQNCRLNGTSHWGLSPTWPRGWPGGPLWQDSLSGSIMNSVLCMSLSLWAIDFRLYLTRLHKIASDCNGNWHVFFGQDFGPFKVRNHLWRARFCCIYALLLEQIHPTRLQSSMVLLRFETCCSRKPIHFAPAGGIRKISRRRECPNRSRLLYANKISLRKVCFASSMQIKRGSNADNCNKCQT